jgi:hypothetical protein
MGQMKWYMHFVGTETGHMMPPWKHSYERSKSMKTDVSLNYMTRSTDVKDDAVYSS